MKCLIVMFFLAALSGLAAAQPLTLEARPQNIDAERAKIDAERVRLEAGFLAEDIACYEKFDVNSCLGKVNARRREVMAELRRKEVALNDEERRIRGEQEMMRIEEKSSPENLQQAAAQRAKAAEAYQLRLDREKDKQQGRTSAPSSEKAARDAGAQRLLDSQKKASPRPTGSRQLPRKPGNLMSGRSRHRSAVHSTKRTSLPGRSRQPSPCPCPTETFNSGTQT